MSICNFAPALPVGLGLANLICAKVFLKELSVFNFKNYDQLELRFSPKMNCFTGLNGVGKTNLLDAIHFLALTKSYFGVSDLQAIRHDEKFFVLQGLFERLAQPERIVCSTRRGQKKVVKRNGKDYPKMADHIGLVPIVMVSPSDYSLIADGSEERRKFLDSVISQYDHEYLNQLIRYNRALAQRNSILKQERIDPQVLMLWDEQLFGLNEGIFAKRTAFIEQLTPIFQEFYERISGGREEVRLDYKSQLQQGSVRDLFKQQYEKDRVLQYTSLGVHRDDLVLGLGDYAMRRFGSQGQQKSLLVALKFAQFDFVKRQSGVPPILLLDDIFDKLDTGRVAAIVQLVSEEHFGQIFITDTNHERMLSILERINSAYHVYQVRDNLAELSEQKD